MAIGIRILSNNLSGQTTDVIFLPQSGGTVNLGTQVFPFTYISDYVYGTYNCYVPIYGYTYSLDVLAPTPTPTNTPTNTKTPTNTPTNTKTPTNTPTPTNTQTPTNTTTSTPTNTETPTQTPTNTNTPTPTNTETPTQTPTNTNTPTPTNTNTPSVTPTNTGTPTNTSTPTNTETPTQTPTNTNTPTPTNTGTPTNTPTPTNTETPTQTPTQTLTPTNTETPTQTPTSSPTPTIPATLPTVTTDGYGSLFNGGAQITGTIVSNGGSTITERGIVWSTSQNPTIANNIVSDGSGNPDALGQFVHTYAMLPNPHGTPVYVRIYATNAIGTSYGTQVSFTMPCFIKGTKITLSSGLRKNIEDISYDDSLLVWNFDEGRFDSANPIWIMTPVLTQYVNILFSDGSNLGISGHLNYDGGHRIFNLDKGEFTYAIPNEHSPIGTRTFNDKGDIVTIVGKEESTEVEEIYNVVTNRHLNIFAEGILTSRRLNNLYPIEDMKFIKDERSITSIEEFKGVPVEYYEGLRLGEQPLATNSEGFLVKTPGELAYTLPTVSELEQWTVEFIKKKS